MYARPTRGEDGKISIPENYDGVAFMERTPEPESLPERSIRVLGSPTSEAKISPQNSTAESDTRTNAQVKEDSQEASGAPAKGGFFGLFDRLPMDGFFGRFRGVEGGNFRLPKIGIEEVLIIATAVTLFFSKEGDKECAIMLILLLFIVN